MQGGTSFRTLSCGIVTPLASSKWEKRAFGRIIANGRKKRDTAIANAWQCSSLPQLKTVFKTLRLLLEIAERYVILAVLTMTAPLAFAMGGSKSTADIFSGWCRMYGSMVIFTALPNIFFGYRSSDTDAIAQMTGQAMTIGGVYMSLDDFEAAQIDSVVTGIVAEYEESGTNIDRIEVSGSMTEKDLLWIIAINSAAYQQDLNAMSADLVRNFCKSSLSYFPSLGLAEDGGDGVVTTLTVKVKHLDPDELMDELGFDKDAKQWAGALYETLEQSDAINKYRTYYETYRPDHSGDGSFSGDVEYGTDYDNQIDISRFVDPSTKNNLDLAAYAVQAWENNWGYVWGTYGNILTPSLFAYKKQQYPDGVGNHADFIESHWLGRRTADCIGLIKGYGWLDNMRAKHNTAKAILQRLNEEADTARRYLDACELEVLEPRYSDNFVVKLLYEILNKQTGQRVRLPDGVFDMTTAVHGIYEDE